VGIWSDAYPPARVIAGTFGPSFSSNAARDHPGAEVELNPAPAASETAMSDMSLVLQAVRGNDKAFEIIMRRNNRTLYRAARGILQDDAEAEDAVQEAYLRAYRAMGTFNGEAKLATWLTRIVINESLERLRKRKQETGKVSLENVVDLEMHIDNAVDGKARPEGPETAAMRAQTRRLLEHKIDQLPAATVRTRFFRAKSLLRESLAREIDTVFEDAFAFAGDRCDRSVSAVLERVRLARTTG
jgi:RNA polymerase sigma-70 factor (ECF subfamily)